MFSLFARIDHMRDDNLYYNNFKKWTDELDITGRLIIVECNLGYSKNRMIVLLIFSKTKENINNFIKKWRTECVDINARNEPCTEKMMDIISIKPNKKNIYKDFKMIKCKTINGLIKKLTSLGVEISYVKKALNTKATLSYYRFYRKKPIFINF